MFTSMRFYGIIFYTKYQILYTKYFLVNDANRALYERGVVKCALVVITL